MNKILFLFILLLSQLTAAQNKKCFSKDNSSSFFFINGILNADESDTVKTSVYQLRQVLNKDKIKLFYNESENIIADLEETFGFIDFNKKEKNNLTFFSEKKYVSKSKEFYDLLSKDKINIVIAHSEGNLFAERMCLSNTENKIIENISIAPPLEKLSCNTFNTYVLFDTDLVINKIDVLKKDFKELKPTHSKGFGDISHSLEAYLNDASVVSALNEGINRTVKLTYEKNFSFKVAELSVKPDNVLDKASNSVNNLTEKISLWSREKTAFMKMMSYASSLTQSLNSKNVVTQILKTEIPADNEQEFADMLAYSLNLISSLCKVHLPKEFNPICSSMELKDYFSQKEDSDYFPYFSALKVESQQIVIQCNNLGDLYDNSEDKKIPVSFYFKDKAPDLLLTSHDNKLTFELDTEAPIKNRMISVNVGEFNLIKDKDELSVDFKFRKPELNFRSLAQANDLMLKCNTLEKLASKKCSEFFKHIKYKYFSYYQ